MMYFYGGALGWAVVQVDACLPIDCGGKNHLLGEHIDYTRDHLPENSPEVPKKVEASPASFDARIAFSNFVIRS